MTNKERHSAFCKAWTKVSNDTHPQTQHLVDAALKLHGENFKMDGFALYTAIRMMQEDCYIGVSVTCDAAARIENEEIHVILVLCSIVAGRDRSTERDLIAKTCNELLSDDRFLKLPIVRALSEGAVPVVPPGMKAMCEMLNRSVLLTNLKLKIESL